MGIVHVFVNESSRSSWTKLYREFGSTQEHELRGNSEFVQYHTDIGIGTFWRDSWCEYDWKYISFTSGQVDRSKSTCLLGFCSMPSQDYMSTSTQFDAIERWEGQAEEFLNVRFSWRVTGNRWRSNWTRVEYLPIMYVIADSSGDPG